MEVKEKNCVITLTYTEKQPSNTQRSIQIQKKPLGGRSQDGGGVGRGDHFLFYKFIERTTER